MAKLVQMKTLNGNPNAVETNSLFTGTDGIEIYRTDKNYAVGEVALYLNATTGKFEAFRCIAATAGTWAPSKWRPFNVKNEVLEVYNDITASRMQANKYYNSGFIDFRKGMGNIGLSISKISYPPGTYSTPFFGNYMSELDRITLNDAQVLIAGNILDIDRAKRLQLSPPPSNGYREDFVFLEAWYEQVNQKEAALNAPKLSYRIRVVDDIDFITNPEGFTPLNGSGAVSGFNFKVAPQGGNSSPKDTVTNTFSTAFYDYLHVKTFADGGYLPYNLIPDYGLYMCGRGTDVDKEYLKTHDGFVYAIPLFRIKRRNSLPYSLSNPNGAKLFYARLDGTVTSAAGASEIEYVFTDASHTDNFKVGDIVSWKSVGGSVIKDNNVVTAIDKANRKIKILLSSAMETSTDFVCRIEQVSDRPDKKFSNVIDAEDIIDLRHQVSLNGFDYDKILKENVDKYLRGELNSVKETYTEQFGLLKAPVGKLPSLMAKDVVGDDGVTRKLTNMFGILSKKMPLMHWIANGETATSTVLNNSVTRINKTAVSNFGTIYVRYQKVTPGTHYLVGADITLTTGTFAQILIDNTNPGLTSESVSVAGQTKRVYVKIHADQLVGKVHFNFHLYLSGTQGSTATIKDMAVYEISKEEYDKLFVTEGFLTNTDISKKYPYVDSFYDITENLFDVNNLRDRHPSGGFFTPRFEVNDDKVSIQKNGSNNAMVTYTVKVQPYTTIAIDGESLSNSFLYVYSGTSLTEVTRSQSLPIKVNTDGNTELTIGLYTTNVMDTIFNKITVSPLDTFNGHSPFGRWFTPVNAFNSQLAFRTTDYSFTEKRKTWSYGQAVDSITDLVEALSTPQSHITVTQATRGTWAVNDTIKIRSNAGILLGALDSDTTISKIVSYADGNIDHTLTGNKSKLKVDSVVGLIIGDTVSIVDMANIYPIAAPFTRTITDIDTVNNVVTLNTTFESSAVHQYSMVEISSVTSTPLVKLSKNDGTTSVDFTTITWSGLGTKEITGTITSINTDSNKGTFSVKYNVSYPAGSGLKNVPDDILEVKVNGQKYVKTTSKTIQSNANFIGKVRGSTTANPHIFYVGNGSTLFSPSVYASANEAGTYNTVLALDGNSFTGSTATNGNTPQHLFSFNLIEHVQRTYGTIPGAVTAEKVAWLKANISKLTFNWWGFGSSPTGNKATLRLWNGTNWASFNTSATHSNSKPAKLFDTMVTVAQIAAGIQNDGFVHALAFVDPSDGVTSASANTDYAELQIELSTDIKTNLLSGDNSQTDDGYEIFVPENKEPVYNTNLLTQNQSYPIGPTTGFAILGVGTSHNLIRPGVLEVTTGAVSSYNGAIITRSWTETNTIATVGLWFKGVVGQTYRVFFYSSTDTADTVQPTAFVATGGTQYIKHTGNLGLSRDIRIDTSSYSTKFEISNVILTLGMSDNKWAPGRKRSMILNYTNKMQGNIVTNPHRILNRSSSLQLTGLGDLSTDYSEASSTFYKNISNMDGTVGLVATSGIGSFVTTLIEVDLNHLGMSVSELRKNITSCLLYSTLYGEGENNGVLANGAKIERWQVLSANSPGAYDNRWNASPRLVPENSLTTHTIGGTPGLYITDDGKMYWRISADYPTGATYPSRLYIDNIYVTLSFGDSVDQIKQNVVKIRKATKEVKLHFPKKSYINGQEDIVEITYSHTPVTNTMLPSQSAIITILAELDYALASDLSSAVGHKQGNHHYLNPLYKLNLDSTQVYGEFGYAEIPIAADSKNINTGVETIVFSTGLFNGATAQHALNTIKKPLVYTFAYLVLHNSELKILLVSKFTSNGKIVNESNSFNQVLLIPVDGRILTKETVGYRRNVSNMRPTEWKTPTEQVLGFVSKNTAVVGSPSTFPEANIWIEE